jgi:isopentenyl phosphate kinase
MPPSVLLKIGGSIVTEKGRGGIINTGRIQRIANQIAARPDIAIILIHGAGSCGHPEAAHYHIMDGVSRQNREGIARTHAAVYRLNEVIVTALRDEGLEAVGVSPLSGCIAEEGRIAGFETDHLVEMVRLGILPVLHGDVVMDRRRGATVVSGDQLVAYLAKAMKPASIGLATDVPGVLRDGSVIPEMSAAGNENVSARSSEHTDVTGGMAGKLAELLVLASQGITTQIFHADRLGDFLDGKPHGGTIIRGV